MNKYFKKTLKAILTNKKIKSEPILEKINSGPQINKDIIVIIDNKQYEFIGEIIYIPNLIEAVVAIVKTNNSFLIFDYPETDCVNYKYD